MRDPADRIPRTSEIRANIDRARAETERRRNIKGTAIQGAPDAGSLIRGALHSVRDENLSMKGIAAKAQRSSEEFSALVRAINNKNSGVK